MESSATTGYSYVKTTQCLCFNNMDMWTWSTTCGIPLCWGKLTVVKIGFRETQRVASSILGHSQCVLSSQHIYLSQNNCKCLYGCKSTWLFIWDYSNSCRYCFVWNSSHRSCRKFKHSLPHPRIWQLGIPWNCFTLARVYFMLSSWIICFSLSVIPGVHIPYAILLLSTNYVLYGTALAAIYLLLPAAICLTAVIYTVDQVFCINAEFRLTARQGFQQAYRLLVATVAFVGAAGFAASLHLLLLHSKNGQKTQSISTTVFIMFSTVFPIVAPWAIRTAVRKMQQVLIREWEAIHEETGIPLHIVQEMHECHYQEGNNKYWNVCRYIKL